MGLAKALANLDRPQDALAVYQQIVTPDSQLAQADLLAETDPKQALAPRSRFALSGRLVECDPHPGGAEAHHGDAAALPARRAKRRRFRRRRRLSANRPGPDGRATGRRKPRARRCWTASDELAGYPCQR